MRIHFSTFCVEFANTERIKVKFKGPHNYAVNISSSFFKIGLANNSPDIMVQNQKFILKTVESRCRKV